MLGFCLPEPIGPGPPEPPLFFLPYQEPSTTVGTASYRPWYPKAVDVLEDDWERMVAFYDFPEDHWKHLRTTNVVESPFAALRLRTTAAKRFKRVESATALIWKFALGGREAVPKARRSSPPQGRV